MDAEELLQRYAAGERDFSGVDLEGANLVRANLSEANLRGANLARTSLREANLAYIFLEDANLEGAISERLR
ncbi:MAG: pentapeptide repeat-containing protein [Nostoc sp. DedQUE04]|uniref:pentapeptide repeat-containing protein n=1 Tax=Nostoc sp. DedQUE04 TaxID=3075390 RepID=UPI002AD2AE84|nr:pentapeptide repeat-containing protein [Nostoc sp. DedQUE04]MDZ8140998.1 pentapeptide repeat-containing protein [Nostoc sp. DedQUE04]